MNKTSAYKDWKGMFDDSVYTVWKHEPSLELRKVSMLIYVIKREFKGITVSFDCNLKNARKRVFVSPKRKISPKISNQTVSEPVIDNKENLEVPNEITIKNSVAETSELDSPDLFQNDSFFSTSSNSKNESILISDDDDFNSVKNNKSDSPEIKKGRRLHRSKIQKTKPTALFLKKDLGIITNASPSKSKKSPKHKITEAHMNPSPSLLEKNINSLDNDTPVKDTDKSKNDSFDSSFIPCTPTLATKSSLSSLSLKQSSRMGSFSKNISRHAIIKKKSKNRNKNSTLTQMEMFCKLDSKAKNSKNKTNGEYDSDETYCDEDVVSEEKTNSENIGITKMLSIINKTEHGGNQSRSYDFGDVSLQHNQKSSINECKESSPCGSFIQPERETEVTEEGLNNLKKINEMLAKGQGVPDYQLEAEPVVRGKARKQLPGWACKECERFFGNQDLSESELVNLMTKCTKHRGYNRPREDTQPGFWNMSLATQVKEQKKTK